MADTSADKTITAYLKRIIGTPVGELIPLTDSDVGIGRTKKSDICINDPNISRNHCALNYSADGWFITDLGGVNGTYLDNDQLMPQIPHPLKDGLGIYLGPPADSPVAFVFIKTKVEDTPKNEEENFPIKEENLPIKEENLPIKEENLPIKEEKLPIKEENVPITEENVPITEGNMPIEIESLNVSNENVSPQNIQPNLKRRAKTTSRQSKKHAPSTSRHQPVSSQSTADGQDSDISFNSLDSLRTRIRKMNSHKKTKRSSNARDNNVASTSASPSLRPSSSSFDCVPSTSASGITLKFRKTKVAKKCSNLKEISAGVFQELESLFNDGSDSLTNSGNGGEDSESLLMVENGLPCGAKQAGEDVVLDKSLRKKQKKMKHLNEQLQKAHNKLLKENSEQKKKLKKMVEESSSKKEEPKENLGEMLEEELICNICTEVFIKATTLGCSHTFCEHCIAEWKKKQKRCPMCREMITSETRILIMDNFIDKVVEKLDKEYQDKRKEVIAAREVAKADEKVKKTKRKKSSRPRPPRRPAIVPPPIRTRRDNHEELRQWRLNLLNEVPFHVGESIELLEMDSESDEEAYEPCHFCGELGHNTSRCPRLY